MFGECHAHMFMNGRNYNEAVACHQGQIQDDIICQNFIEYKKRHVSFVRDGGDFLQVSKRAAQLAGEYGIDYRTPIFAIHKKGHYGRIVGHGFDTMKEYRSLVSQVKKMGGDFIKIMVSGIMDFHSWNVITGTPLEPKEIHEMIHIAHEEGFAVMVHANGAEPVLNAVRAGADSIEHGAYLDENCILAMQEYRTIWVPTIVTVKNLLGSCRWDDKVILKILDNQSLRIKEAYKKGVILALGSDAGAFGVFHGQGIMDEWEAFKDMLQTESLNALKQRLTEGELLIKERFKRKD